MKILNEKKFRLALRMFCKSAKFSGVSLETFMQWVEEEWEKA